jgi:hypothetical protein
MEESEYFNHTMDARTPIYDLAIAWTWQYDFEFVRLLEQSARAASLQILLIDPKSVGEICEQVRDHAIELRYFLDRASDENEAFLPLTRLIHKRYLEPEHSFVTRPINPLNLVSRASDKATMHLELHSHGINVPYTIIISPYNHKKEVELTLSELARLGRPFIIKPANTTGGGVGVVTGAESLKDVLEARQHHRNDKYLLQETIRPSLVGKRRAWFRVFYAFGGILACWWDDRTHLYESLDLQGTDIDGLNELRDYTVKIYDICKLDFFSTELVLTAEQKIVAVDYVNEMCDMRLQSRHADGVPDEVVRKIGQLLVRFIQSNAA